MAYHFRDAPTPVLPSHLTPYKNVHQDAKRITETRQLQPAQDTWHYRPAAEGTLRAATMCLPVRTAGGLGETIECWWPVALVKRGRGAGGRGRGWRRCFQAPEWREERGEEGQHEWKPHINMSVWRESFIRAFFHLTRFFSLSLSLVRDVTVTGSSCRDTSTLLPPPSPT